MTSFEDLGIREPLLRVLEEEELEVPTALQEAVIPVLRRGGNLIARASSGAGKTLAYGLGVLDRPRGAPGATVDSDEAPDEGAATAGPRVLVLVPAAEAAEHVATALFAYAQAVELEITAADAAWATPASQAGVVVSTPAALLDAVRGSALKLDAVDTVVIDDASSIHALGGWEAVDTLLDLVPREAQRVVVSAAFPAEVDDLIERRVKRALRYPAAPAVAEAAAPAEGEVGYVLVSEREKPEILARLLRSRQSGSLVPVLFCRTDERAATVATELTMRGFLVGELDDADADAVVVSVGTTRAELMEETGEETGATVSYDVPADEAGLVARHGGDAAAVVLVEPQELAHLREIARRANLAARAMPVPVETTDFARGLEAFRRQIARAVRERDLAAQMLVLGPLFDEFGAAEVAAAAAALLRERVPGPTPEAAPSAGVAAGPAPRTAPHAAAAAAARAPVESGPPPATWARLYVGVGNRDGVRPGDLVGAIAGEANIPGGKVGRIDIRDTFSIVEVQADVAEQVIRAVNGTTIKARSVRVDYDRGGDRGRRGEGGPPRRAQRERPEGGSRPPVRRPPPRD